jgi:1,4-dihydroxy-2-naphthoate octaprenyltransferase
VKTDRHQIGLLQHLRPLHLLTAVALYLLGAGLAHYLGARFRPGLFVLALLWQVLLLEGFFFLGDYFQSPFQGAVFPLAGNGGKQRPGEVSSPDSLVLYTALGLLAATAALTALLVINNQGEPAVYGLMAGYFLLLGALVLPGLYLDSSGFGEFATSMSLVIFPPALAFLPQFGNFHRYLSLAVFPLFPLHLALILTLRLRSYAVDIQTQRRTLLVRIGWKRAVFLHNMLVLSGFLLFGSAVLFGFPVKIAGPVFMTMLPAAYQVWYYSGLERGAPARWPLIVTLAVIVFSLPVYLLLFAAWIY